MTARSNMELDFARDVDFSQVLTNPILDIAAQLWEPDRYGAFKVCYRSMRRIDDLVDDRKEAVGEIMAEDAGRLSSMLDDWLDAVRRGDRSDPFRNEFLDVIEHFRIPLWPWQRLNKAMLYDLTHDGFSTLLTFMRYAEGAAIAPASIFMHLCGLTQNSTVYTPPAYDLRLAARHLAIFSYLVHIMRDFEKDQLRNLNYFSDDMLASHGLSRQDLSEIARGGRIGEQFRRLMRSYHYMGGYYRVKARRTMDAVSKQLTPRYQLSLEMIYQLYLQIYERIDPMHGSFTGQELNPSPDEIDARIQHTLDSFSPIAP
jgi:phytoene synthase